MSKPSRRPGRRGRSTRGCANERAARHVPDMRPVRDPHRFQPANNPDGDYAVTPCWYETVGDRPEAQQRTHDTLIRLMGAARRGPVSWQHHTGVDAHDMLDKLAAGGHPDTVAYVERMRELLETKGGWICVAYALGDKGAAS